MPRHSLKKQNWTIIFAIQLMGKESSSFMKMTNSNIMTSSHILFAVVSLFLCLFLEGLPQIAHGSSVLTGYTA